MAQRFGILISAALLAMAAPSASRDRPEPAIPSADLAPIALLVDLSSGQRLFARESDTRFVPASITKVMTAYVAFELIEEKRLFPEQVIAVSDEAFEEWNRKGSTMFLSRGQRVTVDELLHGITTVSANDGSIVLAEGTLGSVDAWVELMNAKARELGMRDSHFGTPNGWPDEGRTYTTAADLVKLARAMLTRHESKYRHFFGRDGLEYNGIAQANRDPITGVVEGADGIKTGFTNEAGYGFLGTAVRGGRRLVMVVAAADRASDRARAARGFMEWGFSDFDSRRLFNKGQAIAEARVQDGAARKVPLVASGPVMATMPRGTERSVELRLIYEGPLRAPVKQGEIVGQLEIVVEGLPPSRVPLMAGQAVEKAGWWERLRNGFVGLVA